MTIFSRWPSVQPVRPAQCGSEAARSGTDVNAGIFDQAAVLVLIEWKHDSLSVPFFWFATSASAVGSVYSLQICRHQKKQLEHFWFVYR